MLDLASLSTMQQDPVYCQTAMSITQKKLNCTTHNFSFGGAGVDVDDLGRKPAGGIH
jgi:hypothetical protein